MGLAYWFNDEKKRVCEELYSVPNDFFQNWEQILLLMSDFSMDLFAGMAFFGFLRSGETAKMEGDKKEEKKE